MAVQKYYKLPLRVGSLFSESNRMLARCSEKEAIDQHLELILLTCPGEHRFDPEYGSYIWDLDFERMDSANRWKDKFTAFVKESLVKHETRLENMEIRVEVHDSVREDDHTRAVSVRKRAEIYVLGNLCSTGEKVGFVHNLYLGPITNE